MEGSQSFHCEDFYDLVITLKVNGYKNLGLLGKNIGSGRGSIGSTAASESVKHSENHFHFDKDTSFIPQI